MKQTIEEKIKQRRLQILVHSYIYYELNDNIVSDSTWSKWAKELVDLQEKYPKESKSAPYYEQFIDFDGSTGMDLTIPDDFIVNRANYLLSMRKPLKSTGNSSKSAKKSVSTKKKRLF